MCGTGEDRVDVRGRRMRPPPDSTVLVDRGGRTLCTAQPAQVSHLPPAPHNRVKRAGLRLGEAGRLAAMANCQAAAWMVHPASRRSRRREAGTILLTRAQRSVSGCPALSPMARLAARS